MTFVVLEECIQCKHTDCVAVCPVDCFYEGPNFLVINPEECIDCALCEPECPVDAIRAEEDVPEDQKHFIQLNADLSGHPNWIQINTQKPALDHHEQWTSITGKLAHLDRNGA